MAIVLVHAVRIVIAWLSGSLVGYMLASILHAQIVLRELEMLGIVVPLSVRLSTTWGDVLGLRLYGIVMALSMAIGFAIMHLTTRPMTRPWHFALGGSIAIATALIAMRLTFSITPIASAREPIGLVLHCLAGGTGGLVFALLGARTARATP